MAARRARVLYTQTGSKPPVPVMENPLLEVGETFYARQTLYLTRALDSKVWQAGVEKGNAFEGYPEYPKRVEAEVCEKCGTVLREATSYQRSYAGTEEEFVVIEAVLTGGGTTGRYDRYPDGHRVTAISLRDKNFRIQFYQSGSFIPSVTVPASCLRKSGKRTVERPLVIS